MTTIDIPVETLAPTVEIITKPVYDRASEVKILRGLMSDDGIPDAYLEPFVNDSWRAKESLSDVLWLGEDRRRTILVPDNSFMLNSRWIEMLSYMLNESRYYNDDKTGAGCSTAALHMGQVRVEIILSGTVPDEKGREMRLAKWFSRFMHKSKHFTDWVERYTSTRATNVLEIISKATEEAKTASKRKMIISTNPLDFLLSAEQCGYSSCHCFTGCHFNGNISYSLDDITALVFIINNDVKEYPYNKMGRAWLYFNEERNKFIVGQRYGTFPDTSHEMLVSDIKDHLSEHMGLDREAWKDNHDARMSSDYLRNIGYNGNNHEQYPAYFDKGIASVHGITGTSFWSMKFMDAMCLECGADTANAEHGKCEDCDGKGGRYECYSCDSRVHEDDIRYVECTGNYYCEDCLHEDFMYCEGCHEYVANDDMVDITRRRTRTFGGISTEEIHRCDSCFSNGDYFECVECRDNYAENMTGCTNKDGDAVCDNCSDEYKQCGGCDESSKEDEFKNGVCSDCADDGKAMCPCGCEHVMDIEQ